MILKKKIPNDFYKLFRTKNREAYMQFVTAIYEENNEVYASLGLTQEECALIIENTIEKSKIVWQEEDDMEEGETPDALFPSDSPSGMLNHLIRWGWLKSDFDEKLGYVSGEDPPGVGESRGGQKRCSACKIFSFAW